MLPTIFTTWPNCTVAVAAIDGRDLDPENGIYHADTGITTYTLWGEIAYQIGGVAGYQLLQGSDKSGIAPGTSVLERLVEGKPSVIVLDEIACYLRKAKAKQVGNNSNASEQGERTKIGCNSTAEDGAQASIETRIANSMVLIK